MKGSHVCGRLDLTSCFLMCSNVVTGVLQSRKQEAQKRAMETHVANTVSFKNGKGHQPEHGGSVQPGKVNETSFPKSFQKEHGCANILILAQGDQF